MSNEQLILRLKHLLPEGTTIYGMGRRRVGQSGKLAIRVLSINEGRIIEITSSVGSVLGYHVHDSVNYFEIMFNPGGGPTQRIAEELEKVLGVKLTFSDI